MESLTSKINLKRHNRAIFVLATVIFSYLISAGTLAQECNEVFDDKEIYPASGGILDGEQTSPHPGNVYVTVPLLPVDSTSYAGKFTVEFIKENSSPIVLKPKDRDDVFEAHVPAGRYELVVTHSVHKVVAPRRYVTVIQPKDGSGVLTIPTYISKTPTPYFRMDRSLIPFKTEEDLVAVVFQADPPDDLPDTDDPTITPKAKDFADLIHGNILGIEPIADNSSHPDRKVRKLRYVSAHGTVWMFKLSDPSVRQKAIVYLRKWLPRPARIGIPINLRNGQFHVLDNFFVVLAKESVVIPGSKKINSDFIPDALPVQWITPKKIRKKMGDLGRLLIKFDEDRTLCQNIQAIERAHQKSLYGEPDLLALLSDAEPVLPDDWPDDQDYSNLQKNQNQAHELQHIRQAWELNDARNAAGKVVITSADVFVATVDRGIDPTDPDIVCDSSLPGSKQLAVCYDYPKSRNCTKKTKHSHGMSVFGIISACTANGTGPAGVAPGARHIVISRPIYTATTVYADALRYVGGIELSCSEIINPDPSSPCPTSPLSKPADIISNSHSFSWDPVGPPPFFAPATGYELPVATDTAFQLLITEGRSGKGALLLYAAANVPAGDSPQSADLHQPMARDSRVLGIANCWWDGGKLAPHPTSNFGTSLDVCGIGNGSVTIRGACESRGSPCPFGGTSAATPTVAGVAALILSANKCLSWSEVQQIITSKVTLVSNGSGFGSGLINAKAAVEAAKAQLPAGGC